MRLSSRRAHGLIALVFVAHVAGLISLFDPAQGLFDTKPIIDQDWGLHFHHLSSTVGFFQTDGRWWGYNPYFMAGYPSNTIQDCSIKLLELLSVGGTVMGLAPIQTFKILVMFATAMLPWLVFWAARAWLQGQDEAIVTATVATFLATLYWWAEYPREMAYYGMVGFPVSCYLPIGAAALLFLIGQTERRLGLVHLGWLLCVVALPPIHLEGAIILALFVAGLLIASGARARRRILLWTSIGALTSVGVNLGWMIPFVSHLGDNAAASIQGQLPIFTTRGGIGFVTDYFTPGGSWTFRPSWWANGLRWCLLVAGTSGLVSLVRSPRRDVGWALAGTAAFLFVVTYFGSLVPAVAAMQPVRFKIGLDLILCLGAAYAIAITPRLSSWRGRLSPLVVGAGAIAAIVCIVQTESAGRMRLRTTRTSGIDTLLTWIAQNSPADARLLFEESGDETGFIYDGMYLSSFIPYETGLQLIGGPINIYNDRHHFAEFHSGRFFQHDITTLTNDAISQYLRTYNISAIVTFTPQSVQRFLHQPNVVESAQLGPLHLLIVDQPLTWFLKGSGTVDASLNHLRLSNLAGDDVVLKYHWVAGLRASPDATIETVYELDDPIPFIRLVKPPASLDLSIRRP